MEVDAGPAASEKLEIARVGAAFQPTSEAEEEPSAGQHIRLNPWPSKCKGSRARKVLGMGVGHDEKYKDFQDFCKKAMGNLGIAFKVNTSPKERVWDQLVKRVLALEMMVPYVELYRADDKSLESHNIQVAINHLLCGNAKTRKTKKMEAAKTRRVNEATPCNRTRINARHPVTINPATQTTAIDNTTILKDLELERTRVQLQHYKLKVKIIMYKKKYLDLEKKCIRAKYRARYNKLKRKLHII
ncbi:hypothetical protein RUND412_003231 [Rhizina undulata]